MHALRRTAALLVAAAAVALAASAILAIAVGGLVFMGSVYAAFALVLWRTSRRVRPQRRYLFARR
jgi:hypothetical protein